MRTTLVGPDRAHRIAAALSAVAHPCGLEQGWEISAPGVRIQVWPDGTVDVESRSGTAVLRGALGDPDRVAALVGSAAQVAAAVAERFRPTPVGRW